MCCENLLWPAGWEKCWIPQCVWHSHLSLSWHEKSERSPKDRCVFSRNKGTNIVSKEVAKTALVTADLDQASKPFGGRKRFSYVRPVLQNFYFCFLIQIQFHRIYWDIDALIQVKLHLSVNSINFMKILGCWGPAFNEYMEKCFSPLLKDNANLNFHQTSSMCCIFISLLTNLVGYVCCIIFPWGDAWDTNNPGLRFSEEHKSIKNQEHNFTLKNTANRARPKDFWKIFVSVVCRRPNCNVVSNVVTGMGNPEVHPNVHPK